MVPRHFLDLDALDGDVLQAILREAHAMKAARKRGDISASHLANGLVLAMLFDKPSTRTRVSFDVGMRQLGGQTLVLNSTEMQLGRGETVADTAKVLSRYVDIIMLRSNAHERLMELADNSTVPVINGLTDRSHPCQIFTDIMTFEEHRGPIAGRVVAWTGDASNNVATSWIHGAARFGFTFRVGCPDELRPSAELLAWAKAEGAIIEVTADPREALSAADCVVTDVWLSMGQNDEARRMAMLQPYQVNANLMDAARPEAIFMHCLPAHRGREVTAEVMDGPQSVVFDEAENRLHGQRAILAWCLEKIL
ncbi:MAG: ornithine carbamoyltransferase [Hyphomicrobiales bacterium]|nr:ornithine carbamoyltransferase [Hyphomicrobiales bacterium]